MTKTKKLKTAIAYRSKDGHVVTYTRGGSMVICTRTDIETIWNKLMEDKRIACYQDHFLAKQVFDDNRQLDLII